MDALSGRTGATKLNKNNSNSRFLVGDFSQASVLSPKSSCSTKKLKVNVDITGGPHAVQMPHEDLVLEEQHSKHFHHNVADNS